MSAPTTAEELLELVKKSGLLELPRLEEYVRQRRQVGELPGAPGALADALVRDGLLTPFQARQLLGGRFHNFVLSGKYRILRPLGAGGMGRVYLCEHAVLRRLVAVKLLPPGRSSDPAAVERFQREARAVARLHHPNIVAAHDADRDGARHFLVMEYIDGPTLDRLVREGGPLPPAQAAGYVRQAALGLQHAHEHGLVHRDVKPSNLLVDRAGTVKVLDLGLARFFHDEADDLSARHESPVGTADYMAPEQALDSHAADVRADIYGLGATLYFLLAGRGPFQEGTVAEKILWHQSRQPRPVREVRPEVPAGMAAVLERMMAKQPGARYQAPAEVAEALAPWAETVPPRTLPEAEGKSAPPWEMTSTGGPTPTSSSSLDIREMLPPVEGRTTAVATAAGGNGGVTMRQRPGRERGGRWAVAAWLAGGVLAVGVAVALALYGWAKFGAREDGGPPVVTTEPAAPALRLLVPAYFYPDGEGLAEWQRLLRAPDPAAVVIIANPDSGPGKVADPNFLRVLEQAREKGFTVIGYVSTRYGKRPAEEVKEDVDRWVRLYQGVQGIFFDEQASAADRVGHYADLYQYTRRQRGLRLVVGNPGTTCAEEYVSRPATDVVCLVETAKPFSEFRPPRWASDYKAGRFAAVLSDTKDPARMKEYVLAMAERHIGYCYVTDETPPNPWGRLPSYWEAELAAVRQANERKRP